MNDFQVSDFFVFIRSKWPIVQTGLSREVLLKFFALNEREDVQNRVKGTK